MSKTIAVLREALDNMGACYIPAPTVMGYAVHMPQHESWALVAVYEDEGEIEISLAVAEAYEAYEAWLQRINYAGVPDSELPAYVAGELQRALYDQAIGDAVRAFKRELTVLTAPKEVARRYDLSIADMVGAPAAGTEDELAQLIVKMWGNAGGTPRRSAVEGIPVVWKDPALPTATGVQLRGGVAAIVALYVGGKGKPYGRLLHPVRSDGKAPQQVAAEIVEYYRAERTTLALATRFVAPITPGFGAITTSELLDAHYPPVAEPIVPRKFNAEDLARVGYSMGVMALHYRAAHGDNDLTEWIEDIKAADLSAMQLGVALVVSGEQHLSDALAIERHTSYSLRDAAKLVLVSIAEAEEVRAVPTAEELTELTGEAVAAWERQAQSVVDTVAAALDPAAPVTTEPAPRPMTASEWAAHLEKM